MSEAASITQGRHSGPLQADADAPLVQAARSGDQDAFARLYDKYKEKVYRIAYRYTRDKEKSLDLCQETFIKAFQSLNRFRFHSSFYTWLFRIAYNTCIDHLRSTGKGKFGELNDDILDQEALPNMNRSVEPRPDAQAQASELRERLDQALEALPDAQRSVFVLHVMEHLQYKEIAEVMDCSIGTVMSRLFYARRRLQGLLRRYLVSP
jgi:RNA polymerase sigma-70 factor (ECF subfamily)